MRLRAGSGFIYKKTGAQHKQVTLRGPPAKRLCWVLCGPPAMTRDARAGRPSPGTVPVPAERGCAGAGGPDTPPGRGAEQPVSW